jgi:protein required for attachment to host cells
MDASGDLEERASLYSEEGTSGSESSRRKSLKREEATWGSSIPFWVVSAPPRRQGQSRREVHEQVKEEVGTWRPVRGCGYNKDVCVVSWGVAAVA